MKKYISELERLKKNTLVTDFIECWEGHHRDVPDYEKLNVKFVRSDLTLSKLDEFRKSLVQNCLPSLIDYTGWIYYEHFKSGCFVVTWLLPVELALLIQKNISARDYFLKDYEVIHISIGDTSIYNTSSSQGMDHRKLKYLILQRYIAGCYSFKEKG